MKKIYLLLASMAALTLMGSCNGSSKQTTDAQEITEDSTVMTEQVADTSIMQEKQAETTLTFADVAGIYDSFDEDGGNESRICLYEDGAASWNMIGSLHYTEYIYTITGNTICLKVEDVDSEEECYDYDPVKKTLSNEQGALYYYQDIE